MAAAGAEVPASPNIDCVGDFSEGDELHRRVPAEMWTVTSGDLRHLRRLVCEAIGRGELRPTARDPFDVGDRWTGPSIYTVTEQLIKPVTAQAGGMSWALMRHPRGARCDLFITHAWQEGVFEFIDKVLESWPRGSRHAWCCMLAIPQNLRVSELIANPSMSPFAAALAASRCMLVVPNRQCSIYTRLWCVYEAYLAYQWDKVIVSARTPARKRVMRALPWVLLFATFGGLCSLAWGDGRRGQVAVLSMYIWYPLVVTSMMCTSPLCWQACNCLGAAVTACHFGVALKLSARWSEEWLVWEAKSAVSILLYFFLSEVDRVRYQLSMEEAAELVVGYTGRSLDATCSSAADAASIKVEIADRMGEVDRTIRVLVSAGMSTSHLREAADHGVDLERFTCPGIAFNAIVLGLLEISSSWRTGRGVVIQVLSAMQLALFLCWVILQTLSRRDMKMWAYSVAQKLVVAFVWPSIIVTVTLYVSGMISSRQLLLTVRGCTVTGWAIVLLLSVAHISRVARIPGIGRPLAQVLAARSSSTLRKAWSTHSMSKADLSLMSSSSSSEECDDQHGHATIDPGGLELGEDLSRRSKEVPSPHGEVRDSVSPGRSDTIL